MKIIIETVSHMSQRYNTIGDWQWFGDTLQIKVSAMGDWRKEFLVAFHELIEVALCKKAGVTEEEVDAFDLSHPELHEPGDDIRAPYHHQHSIAIDLETKMMIELDVNQNNYEEKMEHLQTLRDLYESKGKAEDSGEDT
jgi:hypothetical protein